MTYLVKSPARRSTWPPAHYVAPVRRRSVAQGPAVNIQETDEAFILSLMAPGRKREQFELSVDKDVLSIHGQAPEGTEGMKYTHREFGLVDFERRFHLPETIDAARVSARYDDGVLYITLPKTEPVQTVRSISVQ
mgnify:CR=1 FL=1